MFGILLQDGRALSLMTNIAKETMAAKAAAAAGGSMGKQKG